MAPRFLTAMAGPLACLLVAHRAAALEVDCLACNFCQGKRDLVNDLTERVRTHIRSGETVQQIAELEGGGSLLRPNIEAWADQQPEAVKPRHELLKYRGSALPDGALFSAYAPCIKVNAVCIGTDKLGHLFQQGWELYRISVLDAKGDRLAERYAEWLEGKEPRENYKADEPYFRKQHSGSLVGYGGFGRLMSGIISNADLAASKAGLRLYKDLRAGRFKSMADYVTPALCEEVNLNDYTPEMRKIVQKNGRQ